MNTHSLAEQRRVELAEAIASAWNQRPISYAIVHGLERYPECIGRDLDVVLHQETARTAVEIAVALGREHAFGTALFRWSYWGLYQLAMLDVDHSTALAFDLLSTTGVWRAKWVRMMNRGLHDRIIAGDGHVGPFRVSTHGRFLKSCVRPLLCGDLSRLGVGQEWPLPVALPNRVDLAGLRPLLGEAGVAALLTASSTAELHARLPGGVQGLQRRWIRLHPFAAACSLADALVSRILRGCFNPSACLFVSSAAPEVTLRAAQELVEEAKGMFVEVRPAMMPGSRLSRISREATVWRAPPVSEFVVTIVSGPNPGPRSSLTPALLRRFLPTGRIALPEELSSDETRALLRKRIVDLLAETYRVPASIQANAEGRPGAPPASALSKTGGRS
jgi:hypothetical protein